MAHSGRVTSAHVTALDPQGSPAARRAVLTRAVIELAVAAAVFGVYRAGRLVTNDSVATATQNAERVLDVQRSFAGSVELTVQRSMLDVPGAIDVLNHFYVYVHFPVTTLFLGWLFARHRDRYPAVRNWFVGVTLAAMVIHVAFPLAPPRMLDGYVDTLREFGPNIYPDDPSRSLANQFAAMPSLHFGWALMVAVAIILVTTSRHRWWWLAHPAATLLAIVATGNHYLLDAAVAAALALVVGVLVFRRQGELSDRVEPVAVVHVGPARRSPPARHRAHQRCVMDRGRGSQPPPAPVPPPTVRPSPVRGTSRISCTEDDPVSAIP